MKRTAIAAALAGVLGVPQLHAMTNRGMVGVKSAFGRYLQAHTDGELHGSNEHRNEEETWFLIEVNPARHVYALQNWRNGRFMSKRTNGCASAVSTTLGPSEQWVLVPGAHFGISNAVAFQSAADGTFLLTNQAGDDTHCGGEVSTRGVSPPAGNSGWPGWWVFEPATAPTPGRDPWNTIGGLFQGVLNNVSAVDVVAVLVSLL